MKKKERKREKEEEGEGGKEEGGQGEERREREKHPTITYPNVVTQHCNALSLAADKIAPFLR